MIPRRAHRRVGAAALLVLGTSYCAGAGESPSKVLDPSARAAALFQDGLTRMGERGRRGVVLPGCRDCHGRDAGGGREGALIVPAVTQVKLSAPTLGRPSYDRESFGRAVRDGVGSDGRSLGPVMPRYPLPESEIRALWDHLERISGIEKRGVESDRVRIGVDARSGHEVLLRLRDALAANELRLHGRSIELVPIDNEAEIASSRVLALLFATDLDLRRRDGGLPLLFPIPPLDEATRADEARSLAPSRRHQLEALLAAAPAECPVVTDESGRALLPGGSTRRVIDLDAVWRGDVDALPSDFVALVSPDVWPRLASKLTPGTRVHAIGPEIAHTIPDLAKNAIRLVLTDPTSGPGVMSRERASERFARTAAKLLRDALALAGRELTRGALVRAFDQMRYDGPDWPNLDFGRHPRTGRRDVRLLVLE